jgi:hypothetical protein
MQNLVLNAQSKQIVPLNFLCDRAAALPIPPTDAASFAAARLVHEALSECARVTKVHDSRQLLANVREAIQMFNSNDICSGSFFY